MLSGPTTNANQSQASSADKELIRRLEHNFLSFAEEMDKKMTLLETGLTQVLAYLQASRGLQMPTTVTPQSRFVDGANSSQSQSQQSQAQASIDIEFAGVETKFFTKRPFPDFEIRIVDKSTREVVEDTNNWHLTLRLMSGHGIYTDNVLSNCQNLVFAVERGRVHVSGLKFLAVSSRNGGFFQFEASLQHEGLSSTVTGRSEQICIKSERLKNDHKVESILDLGADDRLDRAPGIGKKYAKKLAEQGLETVRDLASLDTSPASREKRLALLNQIRLDRGALTEVRLSEMLREAKAVVKRDDGECGAAVVPPPATAFKVTASNADLPNDERPAKRAKHVHHTSPTTATPAQEVQAQDILNVENQDDCAGLSELPLDTFAFLDEWNFMDEAAWAAAKGVSCLSPTQEPISIENEADMMINFDALG
eukprot:c14063_g1_i1.p1 GENE.c14063_g1_i1~~c14063_g1_i1.p1  ORF type:complete len:424 (-),score=89.05 c14063_g1_i1:132-1403(-)